MANKTFTVELTSAHPSCPQQFDVEAPTPQEAVRSVLRHSSYIRDLLVKCDKDGYEGWSQLTISVDATPDGVREFERNEDNE